MKKGTRKWTVCLMSGKMKNRTVSGGERKGSGFASLSSLRLEVFNLLGSFGNSDSVSL